MAEADPFSSSSSLGQGTRVDLEHLREANMTGWLY